MSYRDPKPEILRIEELVRAVKSGDIRLPRFQRPFVWKRKDVLKLLDSIYRGYPIGSILLWNTSERLSSERTIADLEISSPTEYFPTSYLLDGQQRLSSLCGALFWAGTNPDSIWNIAFDLEKEEFIHSKDGIRIEQFPLNKLLNTSDFINQCKSFEAHPKRDKLFQTAEKLLRSIKDYKIAAVRMGEMTISEVAPIFERINSTGRRLTIVDLMRAATWQGGFDLNDSIDMVRRRCDSLNFVDIPENHILRNISATAGLGINREDIDRLRTKSSEQLRSASEKCAEAYERAIEFLKSDFPLFGYEFLPYGLQLTFLVEFFNLQPAPTAEQRVELIRWFWLTAISRHFGASNTGQNARDLASIRQFAKHEIPRIPVERPLIVERFLFDDFRLNIANSKSFALLLANKKPRSIVTGELINLSEVLASANRSNFYHIVPPALYPEHDLNKCINVCILQKKESSEFIDQRPSRLIPFLLQKHGDQARDILDSNFIDERCVHALLKDDTMEFFTARSELLRFEIERLTGVAPMTSKELSNGDEEKDEAEFDD